MRAIFYSRTGAAADVLRQADLPVPEPGPGEVRVRIAYSGINPSDIKQRSGWISETLPAERVIPHHDGSGWIEAVGDGVPRTRIGELVWLFEAGRDSRAWGTAAELTVVPAAQAVRMPSGSDPLLGACLGVPAMTAHACVLGDGPVDGATILIAGAAGGVGRAAVQLARWAGARVLATAGSPAQMEIAREAGADLLWSYKDPDLAAKILSAVPDGVDRIVEVALASNVETDVRVARPRATIMSFASGADGQAGVSLPTRAMLTKALTLKWVYVYSMPWAEKERAIGDINAAVAQGALTPPPCDRYPLERIADAHDRVGISGSGRKVVLEIG